ncbi:MAG TPA: phytanoyl-CoA dioxygenase family protein [Caulobacterales bacterium]|jgi:ectoine hydroxylase|nr:phytanoyl-CoA dioxygenase family protein [Caulobacterales bacterium]
MLTAARSGADLTDEERIGLARDGYLVRPEAISPGECGKLADACELAVSTVLGEARRLKVQSGGYIQEYRPRLRTLVKWEPHFPALIQGIEPCSHLSRVIAAFGADERLVAPCRAIANHDDLAPFTEKLNLKRAACGGSFALHQDYPYWAPVSKAADRIATAMVCIDDCTQESGCLEVAPGSHREGVRTCKTGTGGADFEMDPRAFDTSRMKPLEVAAGSVIFFGAFLVHRSAPNRSSRDRRALLYSYQPAGARHLRDVLRG